MEISTSPVRAVSRRLRATRVVAGRKSVGSPVRRDFVNRVFWDHRIDLTHVYLDTSVLVRFMRSWCPRVALTCAHTAICGEQRREQRTAAGIARNSESGRTRAIQVGGSSARRRTRARPTDHGRRVNEDATWLSEGVREAPGRVVLFLALVGAARSPPCPPHCPLRRQQHVVQHIRRISRRRRMMENARADARLHRSGAAQWIRGRPGPITVLSLTLGCPHFPVMVSTRFDPLPFCDTGPL